MTNSIPNNACLLPALQAVRLTHTTRVALELFCQRCGRVIDNIQDSVFLRWSHHGIVVHPSCAKDDADAVHLRVDFALADLLHRLGINPDIHRHYDQYSPDVCFVRPSDAITKTKAALLSLSIKYHATQLHVLGDLALAKDTEYSEPTFAARYSTAFGLFDAVKFASEIEKLLGLKGVVVLNLDALHSWVPRKPLNRLE